MWFSEGFATFAAWMWTEHTGGITAQQAFLNSYNRTGTFWNNTVHDPGVVNQYQSATVYQRGAKTLQSLRRGSATRSSSARWGVPVDVQGRGCRDRGLRRDRSARVRQDLRDFFKQWLYTPGQAGRVVLLLPPPTPGNVGGSVPATLALTLGDPRRVRPFTPAVEKEYIATTTATSPPPAVTRSCP